MAHFAYSNNGDSWRCVEPDWELAEGEILADHELTEQELNELFPGRVAAGLNEIRERALAEVRAQRAPVLDALDGIANRAFRRGDIETAEAADAAAEQLLDITELPAFLEAQTRDRMKAAIMGRYREIAEAVPAAVQSAFREVMG